LTQTQTNAIISIMKTIVGLDLGGTFIKVGLVSEKGKILKKEQLLTLGKKGKRTVLSQMETGIKITLKGEKDAIGIGIGTPGLVDKNGKVFSAPNLPDWNNLPLKKLFQDKFHLPVVVENDVNTITSGEYIYGAGKGYKNIICITLGTGLGGGMILNGKLFRGSKLSAAEIGHIPICYDGPKCNCGNIGCIERYVGAEYISQIASESIKKGRKSKIKEIVKGDLKKITPRVISQAYQKGDSLAKEIWEKVGLYLGTMLSGLINLLNPEIIIIGGGIAQVGKPLFDAVNKEIKKRAFPLLVKDVRAVPAKLGTDSGIISAASLLNYVTTDEHGYTQIKKTI